MSQHTHSKPLSNLGRALCDESPPSSSCVLSFPSRTIWVQSSGENWRRCWIDRSGFGVCKTSCRLRQRSCGHGCEERRENWGNNSYPSPCAALDFYFEKDKRNCSVHRTWKDYFYLGQWGGSGVATIWGKGEEESRWALCWNMRRINLQGDWRKIPWRV